MNGAEGRAAGLARPSQGAAWQRSWPPPGWPCRRLGREGNEWRAEQTAGGIA